MNYKFQKNLRLLQSNNVFKKFEGRLYKGTIQNLIKVETIYIRYKTELII